MCVCEGFNVASMLFDCAQYIWSGILYVSPFVSLMVLQGLSTTLSIRTGIS